MTLRLALPLAFLALAATGCNSLQHVNVHDKSASKFATRVVVRPDGFPATKRSKGGIELGYEQYRGNGNQRVESGNQVTLDGNTITGPDTLRNEVKIQQGHVSYNHLINFGRFELEPRVGLAFQQVDVTAVSATNPALAPLSTRERGTYLSGGITPRFKFNDMMAIEARLALSLASGRRSADGELMLVFNPAPTLSLRAGYFKREQHLSGDFGTHSNLEVELSGPSAALVLNF